MKPKRIVKSNWIQVGIPWAMLIIGLLVMYLNGIPENQPLLIY